MEIATRTEGPVTIVELKGQLDGNSSPVTQQAVLAVAGPDCRLLLDMTNVDFMSSAGLRMLLSTHRQITANKGRVVLVGLSEEIRDTMSMTGFLSFFATCATLDEGLQSANQ